MRCIFCSGALCATKTSLSCLLDFFTLPALKCYITNKVSIKRSEGRICGCWPEGRGTLCQPSLEELASQGPSSPLRQPCAPLSPSPPLPPAETRTGAEGCAPPWMLMWQRHMFNFPQMISIRYGQTVGSLNISSTVQQHPKIRTTKESQVIVEEHGLWGGWLWCRFIVLSQSDQRPSGSKRIISLCLVRFTSFSRVLPFKKNQKSLSRCMGFEYETGSCK